MKRGRGQERSRRATAAKMLLVATLAIAVLWQVGGRFTDEHVVEDIPHATAQTSVSTAFTTTADVNLRAGPDVSHDVLFVLPQQTGITVIGPERDGFVPLQIQGQEGWVSASFIAAEDSVRVATLRLPLVPGPTAVPTIIPTEIPAEGVVPESEVIEVEAPAGPTTAETVSVVPLEAELADVQAGERWVEVDRSTATVTLYEGGTTVAVFQGKMGKDPATDGYYSTAVGTFHVFSMNRELTKTPFAPGVYLTDWVGFDPERSNGFHSPVRDAEGNVVLTGGTTTLGCVRLGEDEARQMFDFAFIGMRVEVHD